MLKNIPPILSPELLKVLCEMGHGDEITIGDGNFPHASIAKNSQLVRLDGHNACEVLDAILADVPRKEIAEIFTEILPSTLDFLWNCLAYSIFGTTNDFSIYRPAREDMVIVGNLRHFYGIDIATVFAVGTRRLCSI